MHVGLGREVVVVVFLWVIDAYTPSIFVSPLFFVCYRCFLGLTYLRDILGCGWWWVMVGGVVVVRYEDEHYTR